MKNYLYNKTNYFHLFVILSIISTILLLPILSSAYIPKIFDVFNHLAGIVQANKALMEGQYILRTAPSGYYPGFRYPFFEFYSPTVYTIAGLIYHWITPSNPFNAFKLTIWLANLFGGVYMYRLALQFVQSYRIALLAAIVYLLVPYHLILINYLGNLTESVAFGLLPSVIFYTLHAYDYPKSEVNLLKMALVWYLLATSHLITFICSTFFIFLFILLITNEPHKWRRLLHIGMGYLFSCALLMWFLAPIVLYSKFLFVSDLLTTSHYPSTLNYLLSPLSIITKVSFIGLNKDILKQIHPSPGLPSLIAGSLCFYLVFMKRVDNKYFTSRVTSLVIVFLIVFFIIWSPIHFWDWLPSSFGILQYTWRLLSQLAWIGALLFACSLAWFYENQWNKIPILIGILLILLVSLTWFNRSENRLYDYKFITEHPYLMLNSDAYLFNADKSGVNEIEFFSLHFRSGYLKTNTIFYFPEKIFQATYSPMMEVAGTADIKTKETLLQMVINNKVIAEKKVKNGPFKWEIPVQFLSMLNSNRSISFLFKAPNATENAFKIYIIKFSGFLNPKTTVFLKQLPSQACQQQMNETVCHIFIPKDIRLLELPIFYYPNMLNITLNGNPVSYTSVLQGSYLMTGVTPVPDMINTIHIQFRGLLWANFISTGAWSLFFIFSIYLILRKMTRPSLKE